MADLPCLLNDESPAGKRRSKGSPIVFTVYAPFGTDQRLSAYPSGTVRPVDKQPLVEALKLCAAEGVHVSCLIDLFDDDSYLVEIPAWQPNAISILSVWKQDMSAPQALAGFLQRTSWRFRDAAIVLSIEGHGGGYLPDIDRSRITPKSVSEGEIGGQTRRVRWIKSQDQTTAEPDDGPVPLGVSSPELGVSSPELPVGALPMSTWALGEGLRLACVEKKVPRPAVIHFSNCFNASVEVLHTVAPYADYATGYANYDFFSAGAGYPKLFKTLRMQGSATKAQLARWFAETNRDVLEALAGAPAVQPRYPTIGSSVPLARLRNPIAQAIDQLAGALTQALRDPALVRADVVKQIREAAAQAQHYDTGPTAALDRFDEFIDLAGLAIQLQKQPLPASVTAAAAALQAVLKGLYVYGSKGDANLPVSPQPSYDFSDPSLSLNIFFPDPMLKGLWDWRSPYYLSGQPLAAGQNPPPAPQRHVIDFLADTGGKRPAWVEFIVEYHRDVVFLGFLAAQPLLFPLANPRSKGDPQPPTTAP